MNIFNLTGESVKFILKKEVKNVIVFSPIFVADTKITFGYNFVAPLNQLN